jgi:hypothetical protein
MNMPFFQARGSIVAVAIPHSVRPSSQLTQKRRRRARAARLLDQTRLRNVVEATGRRWREARGEQGMSSLCLDKWNGARDLTSQPRCGLSWPGRSKALQLMILRPLETTTAQQMIIALKTSAWNRLVNDWRKKANQSTS